MANADGTPAAEYYRYKIHYPEKYTIKKLKGRILILGMEVTVVIMVLQFDIEKVKLIR